MPLKHSFEVSRHYRGQSGRSTEKIRILSRKWLPSRGFPRTPVWCLWSTRIINYSFANESKSRFRDGLPRSKPFAFNPSRFSWYNRKTSILSSFNFYRNKFTSKKSITILTISDLRRGFRSFGCRRIVLYAF
jgi:hypothetical protein